MVSSVNIKLVDRLNVVYFMWREKSGKKKAHRTDNKMKCIFSCQFSHFVVSKMIKQFFFFIYIYNTFFGSSCSLKLLTWY